MEGLGGCLYLLNGSRFSGKNMKDSKKNHFLVILILSICLVACFLISLTRGKYPVTLKEIFDIFRHYLFGGPVTYSKSAEISVIRIRVPRLLTCIFAGIGLSISGATYQGVFRNPMVSPDLLGASSGAACGACFAILLSCTTFQIHVTAFIFGLLAVLLTYTVSSIVSRGSNSTIALVLTGIVVSALFNAGVSITKLLADTDEKLGDITFWLMGSMTHTSISTVWLLVIPVVVCSIPMLLFSYQLNVITFGDDEAKTLGVNVKVLRFVFILCSTFVTAASVSACGIVGWIGLVIPHLARMVIGPNYKTLLPASALTGAIFLMLVDNISRIYCQVEISIGILTALVGAPFFLILLTTKRGELE